MQYPPGGSYLMDRGIAGTPYQHQVVCSADSLVMIITIRHKPAGWQQWSEEQKTSYSIAATRKAHERLQQGAIYPHQPSVLPDVEPVSPGIREGSSRGQRLGKIGGRIGGQRSKELQAGIHAPGFQQYLKDNQLGIYAPGFHEQHQQYLKDNQLGIYAPGFHEQHQQWLLQHIRENQLGIYAPGFHEQHHQYLKDNQLGIYAPDFHEQHHDAKVLGGQSTGNWREPVVELIKQLGSTGTEEALAIAAAAMQLLQDGATMAAHTRRHRVAALMERAPALFKDVNPTALTTVGCM
jgi:hypothetical protein